MHNLPHFDDSRHVRRPAPRLLIWLSPARAVPALTHLNCTALAQRLQPSRHCQQGVTVEHQAKEHQVKEHQSEQMGHPSIQRHSQTRAVQRHDLPHTGAAAVPRPTQAVGAAAERLLLAAAATQSWCCCQRCPCAPPQHRAGGDQRGWQSPSLAVAAAVAQAPWATPQRGLSRTVPLPSHGQDPQPPDCSQQGS